MYSWRWNGISFDQAFNGLTSEQRADFQAKFERRWKLLGASSVRFVSAASMTDDGGYGFHAAVLTTARGDVLVALEGSTNLPQLMQDFRMCPVSLTLLGKRTSTWANAVPGLMAAKQQLDAAVDAAVASLPGRPKVYVMGHSTGGQRAALYALMLLSRPADQRRFDIQGVWSFGSSMMGFSCPDGKAPDLTRPESLPPSFPYCKPMPRDEVCFVQLYDSSELAGKTARYVSEDDISATMPWDRGGRDGQPLGWGHVPSGSVWRLVGGQCLGPLTSPEEARLNCSPLLRAAIAARANNKNNNGNSAGARVQQEKAAAPAGGCSWALTSHWMYHHALARCVHAAMSAGGGSQQASCMQADDIYATLLIKMPGD